jgi:hypothetical protein
VESTNGKICFQEKGEKLMTLKDNGDGTISDSHTGLMWQQAENGEEMNYEDAVAFCEGLTLAGHGDWRLPTKEELVALAQVGDEPLRTFFPGLQQERYWAFTRHSELAWAESPDRIAYTVDFDPDSGNYCRPTTYFRAYKYFVRAVCAGGKAQTAISSSSGAEVNIVKHTVASQKNRSNTDIQRHKVKKTASIIALIAAILFCGLPGLLGLCIGPLLILGSNEVDSSMGSLFIFTVMNILFVAIPVLVWFFTLRKKPTGAEKSTVIVPAAASGVSEVVLPNDELRALRVQVDRLGVNYPRQQGPGLDPKLDIQLPWIARTLEEAASALESGRDPFGNPITDAQVVGGLRKLIQMVTEPGYLSTMDLGYPGIKAPLKRCMNDLEAIVRGIEEHPAAGSPPSASKGVKTLVALCTELGILFPDQHINQAVEELLQEGEPGSRALALLIRELMVCRSPKITHVLAAAGRVTSAPELVDAVRAVAEAPELTEAPTQPRFTPEIIGGGRVGWTSGTHRSVVARALQAEELLIGHD